MKVLIIQQKMIGDVLTSSILFEAIKMKYPKAELHYLINSHTFPVVENNPFIDDFKFFTPEIEDNKRAFWRFLKHIKKEQYDVVIDVYSKTSSNLITAFSGAKTKISKYKWYTKSIYTHTFKNKDKADTNAGLAIENRIQLLAPISKALSKEIVKPKIYLTNNEIVNSQKQLSDAGINLSHPVFMIGVLGSGNTKTYPLPHMAKVIDFIVEQTKGQILFNYIPKQYTEAKTIYNFCSSETKKHIYFDVFGKSLREFLAITNHCTALIGNEGGAINMAKALNIPTFSIFSPWIKKDAWSLFEDGKTNASIHLKDIKPELYDGKTMKEMKKDVFALYDIFPPELITPKLELFLEQF
ncbi:glycosyltransferase family 9 protein [Mangrovimonas cancribranchiae]|uniref:Glycosyltransferase family 9 protein n=1 Tax=Mangrovimonas cancribranchiae TaxID=3080055 RepID=A0AAU6P8D1_9FLAO